MFRRAKGRSRAAECTVVADIGHAAGGTIIGNGLVYGENPVINGGVGIGAFAIHPDTGVGAWNSGTAVDVVTANVVIVDSFAASGNTNVNGLDPTTGRVLWSQTLGTPGAGPIAAGNLFYDAEATSPSDPPSAARFVTARRLSDGVKVASFDVGETVNAITPSDGHIYAAGAAKLYGLVPATS